MIFEVGNCVKLMYINAADKPPSPIRALEEHQKSQICCTVSNIARNVFELFTHIIKEINTKKHF